MNTDPSGRAGGTSPAALAQLWLAQQWVALHTHLCSAPSEHQCHSPDTILCPCSEQGQLEQFPRASQGFNTCLGGDSMTSLVTHCIPGHL